MEIPCYIAPFFSGDVSFFLDERGRNQEKQKPSHERFDRKGGNELV